MRSVDVVVIGAGVMGSSVARALTKRGSATVEVFEQFSIGHARGSSHGTSRIFRLSYPDPYYVELARQALGEWREVERVAHKPLLTTTGGLDLGSDLGDHIEAFEGCGVTWERMGPADVASRWAGVHLRRDEEAIFQPDAGWIAADLAIGAFLDAARTGGAALHPSTPVVGLDQTGDGVTLATSAGEVKARAAVVTAGSWAKGLLAPVGIDLPVRPTRETVSYFSIQGDVPPVVEWTDPVIYSLPSPRVGLKAGEHIAGPTTDPNDLGSVEWSSIERVSEWVAQRFPGARKEPLMSETCLYTNTVDESFILERHDRIVVGSPCSGHGFKFAPVIGTLLADLAYEVL